MLYTVIHKVQSAKYTHSKAVFILIPSSTSTMTQNSEVDNVTFLSFEIGFWPVMLYCTANVIGPKSKTRTPVCIIKKKDKVAYNVWCCDASVYFSFSTKGKDIRVPYKSFFSFADSSIRCINMLYTSYRWTELRYTYTFQFIIIIPIFSEFKESKQMFLGTWRETKCTFLSTALR